MSEEIATVTARGHHELCHPAELNLFPGNPRKGDVDAIAASLRANNQYKPITVNKGTHTGRPMEVLAGNHTVKAIRDLAEKYPEDERWQEIDAWVIDVDNDRAERIVLADNRTSELGGIDTHQLHELLSGLGETDAALEGTGYSGVDLQALAEAVKSPDLDDLADEYGEPTEADALESISFKVPSELADEWRDHRKEFETDAQALRNLLDR